MDRGVWRAAIHEVKKRVRRDGTTTTHTSASTSHSTIALQAQCASWRTRRVTSPWQTLSALVSYRVTVGLPWSLRWWRICLQCRPWFDSCVRKIAWKRNRLPTPVLLCFPGVSGGEESACNVGDLVSIPGLGRSPGGGHDNPLQCSCLENPMDRGGWRATVQGLERVSSTARFCHLPWNELFPPENLNFLNFWNSKTTWFLYYVPLQHKTHYPASPREVFWQDSSMDCYPFSLQGFLSSPLRLFWGAAFTYLEVIREWF